MKSNVFNRKNCLIVIMVLVICMIVGSFFDFQIASVLYHPNSIFGNIFAAYGQLPAMLCMSLGGTLLIIAKEKERKQQELTKFRIGCSWVIGILLNIFSLMMFVMDPLINGKGIPLSVSIIIAVIIIILTNYMMIRFCTCEDSLRIRHIAMIFIACAFLNMLVINIIKVFWGRPRMRMLAITPEASFQSWWIIGSEMKDKLMAIGIAAEEFKSFPSGHTGNAACAMLLCLLPLLNKKYLGKENLLFYIGFGFTLVVAFSRMMMGAHFLSDVTVGMSVTFIIEYVWIRKWLIKKERLR